MYLVRRSAHISHLFLPFLECIMKFFAEQGKQRPHSTPLIGIPIVYVNSSYKIRIDDIIHFYYHGDLSGLYFILLLCIHEFRLALIWVKFFLSQRKPAVLLNWEAYVEWIDSIFLNSQILPLAESYLHSYTHRQGILNTFTFLHQYHSVHDFPILWISLCWYGMPSTPFSGKSNTTNLN
jgi:hypothetical protein